MAKSMETMRQEFNKIRTGRAHPSLLDSVEVDYYGTPTPLQQVATITVEGGRNLVISPWDKGTLPMIDKAIVAANLGFNPSTQEGVVRISMPPLTEERREEYVRQAKRVAEQTRISVRNIRRDANNALRDMSKNSEIGKDEEMGAVTEVENLTKEQIGKVDAVLHEKEQQLKAI
jgi:ribosome recycling factor